ncbi:hypothetical protein ABT026_20315 [Streptomyces sp. NPDC002734]|uniref:hypothetical protein n=1 Tax=Streptomyces sp. NPDC002734 TaxID=3154426 RepID=UPI00332DF6F0
MAARSMSGRTAVLSVVVVLALLVAGLGVWWFLSRDEAEALKAPVKPCWNGTPRQDTMQKLLGPGDRFHREMSAFRVADDHWPSYCAYDVEADGSGVAEVLDINVSWEDEDLPADPVEDDPVSYRPGDAPTRMDAGVLAYYLRDAQKIYFECDTELPPDAPGHIKRDRYLSVEVVARPMREAGLSALEARRTGLDILFQMARDVEKQAGCTNDTHLPAGVPSVKEANWADYRS